MGVCCIVKSCDNKQGRPGNTMMFHRIPTKNADLMNRWLLALEIDPNTPITPSQSILFALNILLWTTILKKCKLPHGP